MDNSPLEVAITTLTERCHNYQTRLCELEKENIALRAKSKEAVDSDQPPGEIETLRKQVIMLQESNNQYKNNIHIISSENKLLWERLSKLAKLNSTLQGQFNKINDSLNQHTPQHSPLIRSKTFTQEGPNTKIQPKQNIDIHDKISLELEDISLKLISNIAKEKNELEMQCSQMAELQNDINLSNLGFNVSDCDTSDTLGEDFDNHLSDLKSIKELLLQNKDRLVKDIENFNNTKVDTTCKKCEKLDKELPTTNMEINAKNNDEDKEELNKLMEWGSLDANTKAKLLAPANLLGGNSESCEKICPICSKIFGKNSAFSIFEVHVNDHFLQDDFQIL